MACCLFGTKPLLQPTLTYCHLDPYRQTSEKFESKYKVFHSWKCIWICLLQNGNHFVQGNMSEQSRKHSRFCTSASLSHQKGLLPAFPRVGSSSLVPSVINFQINTLRLQQNSWHFPDDIKCIFWDENVQILIKISLKFVHKGQIDNIPALVQIMACCQPGNKPLSEPMLAWVGDAYMHHSAKHNWWFNNARKILIVGRFASWQCNSLKYICRQWSTHLGIQGPPLLTLINLNPGLNKNLHPL